MLLTDPIYYFGTFLLQKKDTSYSTFEDMSGHTIGTVTGFTLVPELKSIPDVKEVKLYDTSDGVMRDLVAGRLDMAVLDPGLVEYALLQHPEWNLPPGAAEAARPTSYPDHVHQVLLDHGHLGRSVKDLDEAVNAEIRKLWASCANVKTMANYGLGNPDWFDPPVEGLPGRRRPAGGLESADRRPKLLPEVAEPTVAGAPGRPRRRARGSRRGR